MELLNELASQSRRCCGPYSDWEGVWAVGREVYWKKMEMNYGQNVRDLSSPVDGTAL